MSQELQLLGIHVVKDEIVLTPEIAKRGPDHCEELVLVPEREKVKGSQNVRICSQQMRAYYKQAR